MPSKKKKYNARFPAGRIKKIMQTDEEVGKVAQAVPVIISRTLELFVESLLKKTMSITMAKSAKTLSPSHMKQCILSESRFDFLKDLVKDLAESATYDDDMGSSGSGSSGQSSAPATSPTAIPPSKTSPHFPASMMSEYQNLRKYTHLPPNSASACVRNPATATSSENPEYQAKLYSNVSASSEESILSTSNAGGFSVPPSGTIRPNFYRPNESSATSSAQQLNCNISNNTLYSNSSAVASTDSSNSLFVDEDYDT